MSLGLPSDRSAGELKIVSTDRLGGFWVGTLVCISIAKDGDWGIDHDGMIFRSLEFQGGSIECILQHQDGIVGAMPYSC